MKANELRIGNWVLGPLDELMKVNVIGDRDNHNYINAAGTGSWGQNGFTGIPLTPEILEKIGFVRIDHINGYLFYTLSKSKKNRCHIDIYPEKTSWMSYSVKHCKSVHELQNLFYSITGEELEIAF